MTQPISWIADKTRIASSGDPYSLEGLPDLWLQSRGHEDVCIAMLDGPVDLGHPCFVDAKLRTLDTLIPNIAGHGLASQHGTHVASIIFGQHGGPVTGIAPSCSGLVVPVFADDPSRPSTSCSQLDLARAIIKSVEAGANVISVSAGQLSATTEADDYLEKAIRQCIESNVLVVAAAGNDGCDCLHVPAAVPSVLAVGAMDSGGLPLAMSNWGTAYRAQGLLAPGENILGAMPGGGTVRKSGTSFATAVVAGLGALLFSIQRKNGNNLDAQMIRTAILLGATPCELGDEQLCQRFLVGRIDIRGSMTQLERLSSGKNLNARKRQLRLSSQDSELVSGPSSKDFQIQPKRGQHMQAETESVQIKSLGANVSVQETVNNNPTGEPVQPSLAKASAEPASADAISPSCGSEGKPGAAQGACGCGGKCGSTCAKPSLVYALGTLTYDFGTEARRDSLIQSGLKNPDDPTELVAFLAKHPESSTAVVWVLTQESTPIYAIQPIGPYASQTYEQLREFLRDQQAAGMVQISVPGYIFGKAALLSGQIVPTIAPELRGLNGWSVPKLVEAVVGTEPKNKDERSKHQERVNDITNFLERVYYEIRSLGVTPIERATNYAATNAFQVEQVFKKAIKADLKLDSIQAERSPICRPSSDCWDVKLTFFNPAKRFEQARHVYRFTVDVSDVIPVSVGSVRDWDVY